MKILCAFFLAALFISCSDPVAKAKKAQEAAQADSLRTQIKASRLRIDSLRKNNDAIRAKVDSLDMGAKP